MELISGALLIVTTIYVVLTFQIARETGKASQAALASADFARAAAEASLRSALVAEAQLVIRFKVTVNRLADGRVWFEFDSNVNVWIHSATLVGLVLATKTGPISHHETSLQFNPSSRFSLPSLRHAGETFTLEWEDPHYRNGDYGIFGYVDIEYSLKKEDEIKKIAVMFESKKGIGNYQLRKGGIQEGTVEKDSSNQA